MRPSTSRDLSSAGQAGGFTLIELTIAMVLVVILAIALIPRSPSPDSLTLRPRAEQLASDIRYVQTLSMTSGQRLCLTLDPPAGPPYSGYRLTTAVTGCTSNAEHPAGLAQPIDLCGGATCVTVPSANLPNDYVQFSGLGAPFTAPAVALAADAVISVAGDAGPRTVTISPTTGRVLVQ
jgi:prepilin-type N-terminal cleavage/methylation domain-containing protein